MSSEVPADSRLVKVTFQDGPLGVTLRRRNEDGIVFVYDLVPGSQAIHLDIKPQDELWAVAESEVGTTPLDKEMWNNLVTYIKSCPRPLEIVLRRRLEFNSSGDNPTIQAPITEVATSSNSAPSPPPKPPKPTKMGDSKSVTAVSSAEPVAAQTRESNDDSEVDSEEEDSEDEDEEDDSEEESSVKVNEINTSKQVVDVKTHSAVNEVQSPKIVPPAQAIGSKDEESAKENEKEKAERLQKHLDAERDLLELKTLASKLITKEASQERGFGGIKEKLAAANILKRASSFGLGTVGISSGNNNNSQNSSTGGAEFIIGYGRRILRSGELSIATKDILNQMDALNVFNLNPAQSRRHFYLLTDMCLITIPQSNGTFVIETVLELPTCKINAGNHLLGGDDEGIVAPTAGKQELLRRSFDILSPFGSIRVIASSVAEKDVWLLNFFLAICDCVSENTDGEPALGWRHQIMLGTMHAAVISRDEGKVRELIKACEAGDMDFATIEEKDEDGYTPLHYACLLRLHPIIKLLHEASADVTARDKRGLTPIHIAALNLDDYALGLLCSHVFDTDIEDNLERTPLFIAAVEGRGFNGKTDVAALKKCITILKDLQADCNIRDKSTGISIIEYLSASWQFEAVDLLLSNKDVDLRGISGPHGFTALHYALAASPIKRASGEGARILSSRSLAQASGDAGKEGGVGGMASDSQVEELHKNCGVPTIISLLRKGARPNYRDLEGRTPLQILADNSEKWGSHLSDAVSALLAAGARMDDSPQCALLRKECTDISIESIMNEWSTDATINADLISVAVGGLSNPNDEAPRQNSGKDCCILCSASFTLFKRMHHCRMCEVLVCDDCSKKRAIVDASPVRCCDACFNILHEKTLAARQKALLSSIKPLPKSSSSNNNNNSNSNSNSSSNSTPGKAATAQEQAKLKRDLLSGATRSNTDDAAKGSKTGSTAGGGLSETMNTMAELKDRMNERGEKLSKLSDRSGELSNAASDFAKMAKELNRKQTSWF